MKRIQPVTLRGKRLFLRPPKSADYRELAALVKVSRPMYRSLVGNLDKRKYFNDFVKRWEGGDACSFLMCRQADDVIVGTIGLFNIVRRNAMTTFVGYSVGAPFTRQGFATEALQLVLRFAFRKLKLHRVEACIQSHNVPSLSLAKGAGFTCEGCARRLIKIAGRWRDHERWAILVEDWRKSHSA